MDEEQTSLRALAIDTHASLNQMGSINEIAADHLNL